MHANLRTTAVVVVAVHVGTLAWLGYVNAPAWHEPAQLSAGLCWWSFGRSDVSRVNPPFIRLLAAVPVLLLHPVLDPKEFDRPPSGRDEFVRAERFVKDNASHVRQYFALARWTFISFSLVGAYFCSRLANSLYGVSCRIDRTGTLVLLSLYPWPCGDLDGGCAGGGNGSGGNLLLLVVALSPTGPERSSWGRCSELQCCVS